MEDSGQSSEGWNAKGSATSKTKLKIFHLGRRIPLAVGLLAMCFALVKVLSTFGSCYETLQETDSKGRRLTW